MYSVLGYGRMSVDGERSEAHARAIAKTVRPGDVVIDLGAGTGIMSLLALRAGARRVHAIEMGDAVWLARDIAVANGYGDRLVVHHGSSFDLALEERADVIVADLRGSSPLFGQNLEAILDAKRRLLAPGGRLVPSRDRMFVALAETEAHRRVLESGWSAFERNGFDATAAKTATLNDSYAHEGCLVQASHVLSEAKAWAELIYGEPFSNSLSATLDLDVTRGGTAHALVIWFEGTLCEDVIFNNGPGHESVYRQIILPLLEPVRVAVGDAARVTLRTDAGGNQWAWDTQFPGLPPSRQATFLGLPIDPRSLLRESRRATPSRSSSGERAARILAMMDGTQTVDDIVEALAAAEPDARREGLIDDVKGCARRYSR